MKVVVKTNPEVLEHDLNQYFPELLKFNSIKAAERSEVYQKIEPKILEILRAVVQEKFAEDGEKGRRGDAESFVSAAAWNIERGSFLEGIIDKLKNHEDLKDRDLYLLTELDYGMARSDNLFVAREIARALKLNYAFAPVYIALQKGSGV